MKSMSEPALTRIFQGVIAQAPITAQMNCPRLMLMYFGRRAERSVATEIELAEIFTPMEAMRKARAQKNAAALPPYIKGDILVHGSFEGMRETYS